MQGNKGLWAKTFEKSYFNSLSKVTRPHSNFWILPSGKLAVRAVHVWMNNSRKRPQNHFRLHFTSKTPYELDTRGILSTPACNVLVRRKRTTFAVFALFWDELEARISLKTFFDQSIGYRIYSINRPGRLLNFWTLRVGAYSRWALIRGWALIKFSPFSASEVSLFCNETIYANNKTRGSNKARFL